MKTREIREMSVQDLKSTLNDTYEALENYRFQHATGQLENFKALTNTKKDIAKINTILREKELKLNENISKKK